MSGHTYTHTYTHIHTHTTTTLCACAPRVRVRGKLLSQEPPSTHVRLFHSLASANALDIALVRQCKELEISYGTQFWETSINSPEEAT